MMKTTDYTREIKLFHKIGFSFPNSAYLCMNSKKNFNFKFGTFPKKHLKETIYIGPVRIKSLCFPFWILTLFMFGDQFLNSDDLIKALLLQGDAGH